MGMDPEKVPYLMDAGDFLGQARSELIEQRGEDPGRLAKAVQAGAGLRAIVVRLGYAASAGNSAASASATDAGATPLGCSRSARDDHGEDDARTR